MNANLPLLAPGRYIIQDLSEKRAFINADPEHGGPLKDTDLVVALPSGMLVDTWNITTSDGKRGAYEITVNGHKVIQAGPFVGVYTGKIEFNDDQGWDIVATRVPGTGELCYSIGTPPGFGVYYWNVNLKTGVHDLDEHGHRVVTLNNNPDLGMSNRFLFTPLSDQIRPRLPPIDSDA